jgi:hypothetical protein
LTTEGQRSEIYVGAHRRRLDNHIPPFMRDKGLSEITPGLTQEYRIHRNGKIYRQVGLAACAQHDLPGNRRHQASPEGRRALSGRAPGARPVFGSAPDPVIDAFGGLPRFSWVKLSEIVPGPR